MTNSVTTAQSQYYYSLQLNKQMARYQTIFIPSEEVQEATCEFLFLWAVVETQTEETIVHSAMSGTPRTRTANVALHCAFAASFLEAGRI